MIIFRYIHTIDATYKTHGYKGQSLIRLRTIWKVGYKIRHFVYKTLAQKPIQFFKKLVKNMDTFSKKFNLCCVMIFNSYMSYNSIHNTHIINIDFYHSYLHIYLHIYRIYHKNVLEALKVLMRSVHYRGTNFELQYEQFITEKDENNKK